MKPKEYIRKYKLEETPFFNRNEFIDDIMDDFKTTLQNVKLSPQTFKNCVDMIEMKWKNIFNGSKVSKEAADKFWNYFYASSVISVRNMYFPNWKDAVLKHRIKNDPDFARRYECYQMNKRLEEWERESLSSMWEDLWKERMRQFREAIHSVVEQRNNEIKIAKEFLGITETDELNESVINTKYKQLAKMTHPDLGGDAKQFMVLKENRDLLLKTLIA